MPNLLEVCVTVVRRLRPRTGVRRRIVKRIATAVAAKPFIAVGGLVCFSILAWPTGNHAIVNAVTPIAVVQEEMVSPTFLRAGTIVLDGIIASTPGKSVLALPTGQAQFPVYTDAYFPNKTLTPVPEPWSISLYGLGLIVLWFMIRSKRNTNVQLSRINTCGCIGTT